MPVLCERFTIQDLLGKEMGMFRWRCTDCGWTEETHDVIYGRCPACERRARQSTQEKVPDTEKDVRSEQELKKYPVPAASHPQNAKDDAVAPLRARKEVASDRSNGMVRANYVVVGHFCDHEVRKDWPGSSLPWSRVLIIPNGHEKAAMSFPRRLSICAPNVSAPVHPWSD